MSQTTTPTPIVTGLEISPVRVSNFMSLLWSMQGRKQPIGVELFVSPQALALGSYIFRVELFTMGERGIILRGLWCDRATPDESNLRPGCALLVQRPKEFWYSAEIYDIADWISLVQ